jgi:hypothetical protein
MRTLRAALLLVPVLALAAPVASAHHAFSPVYDEKRTITTAGVVTEFRFVNPHAMLLIDVTDETGKVAKWVVEFPGRLNLGDLGWTADSIKAGERVTVLGHPTHTGSTRMFFRRLRRADGTELVSGGGAQRQDALEEARRQRARERDQKK